MNRQTVTSRRKDVVVLDEQGTLLLITKAQEKIVNDCIKMNDTQNHRFRRVLEVFTGLLCCWYVLFILHLRPAFTGDWFILLFSFISQAFSLYILFYGLNLIKGCVWVACSLTPLLILWGWVEWSLESLALASLPLFVTALISYSIYEMKEMAKSLDELSNSMYKFKSA